MKMNSSVQHSGWKLCPVETEASGTVQYVCYMNERCCEQGCCSIYNYKHLQSWYFWLLLVLLCSIFYLCSWYCKKVEESRRKRLRQISNRTQSSSQQISPRSNTRSSFLVDNIDLEKQELSKKKEVEPPPKYLEALAMPAILPVVQIHLNERSDRNRDDFSVASTSNMVPPSYKDATQKKTSENR